jgi:translation initiation factor 2 beta subunit (eIF-2beta)/eIF-5
MVKASFENDESYERLKLILQDQFNPEEVNEKHFLHLFKNIDLRLEEFAFKDESDYEEIFERFTIMQEEFQPDKERDIEAFNKVFYKRRIQPLG